VSGDTLSDLLRAVRLRGAVFYYIDGVSPWVAEAPPAREILPGIMPGAEHLMEFHAVASGSCWAALRGESPLRIEAGDVILFPQGDPHVMSSAPGLRAERDDRGLYFSPRCRACCTWPVPPRGRRRGSPRSCAPRSSSRTAAAPAARRCSSG
jgi:hypothetical protein